MEIREALGKLAKEYALEFDQFWSAGEPDMTLAIAFALKVLDALPSGLPDLTIVQLLEKVKEGKVKVDG